MGTPPRKKTPGLTAVGAVLKDVLSKRPAIRSLEKEHRIWEHWDKVVGTEISRQTEPRNLKFGVLYVETKHSTWITELQYRAETIRQRLNEALGHEAVKEIQFRLARR